MNTTDDDLPEDIEALKRMVLEHRRLLDSRAREIESLKLLIAKLRRMQFGRSSERLEREIEQLEFALDELETQVPVAASPSVAVVTERTARSRALPEHLPRERVVHEPACSCPQLRRHECARCGEDVSEVLEYVPGALQGDPPRPARSWAAVTCETHQRRRRRRPCRSSVACPEPGLLAHVLVAKYCRPSAAVPAERDLRPRRRRPRALDPGRLGRQVLRCCWSRWSRRSAATSWPAPMLHADDTPVPVLDPGRGKTKTGRLWVLYATIGRAGAQRRRPCFYRYSPDRKGERPGSS